jgi:flavodoxin
MLQIGIFYGSTNGHTRQIAVQLKEKLDAMLLYVEHCVELLAVADYHLDAIILTRLPTP